MIYTVLNHKTAHFSRTEELEKLFQTTKYPDGNERERIALAIGKEPWEVQVWFSHRRRAERRKQFDASTVPECSLSASNGASGFQHGASTVPELGISTSKSGSGTRPCVIILPENKQHTPFDPKNPFGPSPFPELRLSRSNCASGAEHGASAVPELGSAPANDASGAKHGAWRPLKLGSLFRSSPSPDSSDSEHDASTRSVEDSFTPNDPSSPSPTASARLEYFGSNPYSPFSPYGSFFVPDVSDYPANDLMNRLNKTSADLEYTLSALDSASGTQHGASTVSEVRRSTTNGASDLPTSTVPKLYDYIPYSPSIPSYGASTGSELSDYPSNDLMNLLHNPSARLECIFLAPAHLFGLSTPNGASGTQYGASTVPKLSFSAPNGASGGQHGASTVPEVRLVTFWTIFWGFQPVFTIISSFHQFFHIFSTAPKRFHRKSKDFSFLKDSSSFMSALGLENVTKIVEDPLNQQKIKNGILEKRRAAKRSEAGPSSGRSLEKKARRDYGENLQEIQSKYSKSLKNLTKRVRELEIGQADNAEKIKKLKNEVKTLKINNLELERKLEEAEFGEDTVVVKDVKVEEEEEKEPDWMVEEW
ncbi:hypothetical protein CRE_01280 [Caenorhabditis remanei]|uniref:Homeobox domain-containing protein n=1 Tax=Caenorhabditis remanei TaxID=31234 RepID=E3N9R3_CAERE|nr:hypothetical protein CRE_01280 [Caenorhabditis remanei]